MGRELRRVPLDFDWPLGEIWKGYQPPPWRDCPAGCVNGATVDAAWLERIVSLLLMAGDHGMRPDRDLHPWLRAVALAPDQPPTVRMSEVCSGLAGRGADSIFGHDACNRWSATRGVLKAAGLPDDWGTCPTCKGHAIHPDDLEASEAWERTHPPEGEGFQLWETTTEGSPQTPVFATLDDLCAYAAEHCTTFGSSKASAQRWRQMLDEGFVREELRAADGSTVVFL